MQGSYILYVTIVLWLIGGPPRLNENLKGWVSVYSICYLSSARKLAHRKNAWQSGNVRKYKLKIFICWLYKFRIINKVKRWIRCSQWNVPSRVMEMYPQYPNVLISGRVQERAFFAFSCMTKGRNLIICLLCCTFVQQTTVENSGSVLYSLILILIKHLSHSMICANARVCRKIILGFMNSITWKVKAFCWKHRT